MIIGLSGTLSAGKDTLAEYLVEKEGFFHVSLSGVLREIARKEGIEETMTALTKLGNAIEKRYGKGYLAKLALDKIPPRRNAVISSIRQPPEIEVLRQAGRFKMIFVDAAARIRFERLKKRAREGDSQTWEEFVGLEKKQMLGSYCGINLLGCKKASDYIIENNGTREEFTKKIRGVVAEILKEDGDGK